MPTYRSTRTRKTGKTGRMVAQRITTGCALPKITGRSSPRRKAISSSCLALPQGMGCSLQKWNGIRLFTSVAAAAVFGFLAWQGVPHTIEAWPSLLALKAGQPAAIAAWGGVMLGVSLVIWLGLRPLAAALGFARQISAQTLLALEVAGGAGLMATLLYCGAWLV